MEEFRDPRADHVADLPLELVGFIHLLIMNEGLVQIKDEGVLFLAIIVHGRKVGRSNFGQTWIVLHIVFVAERKEV